jgi:hypothetical protein
MELIDYADLCARSYEDGPEFTTVGDLVFGVFEQDGIYRVVFRGSSNLDNWLRDVSVIPATTAKGYRTHGGILGAFETMWPEIFKRIPHADPSKVEAVGHSLGGGIAVQMAHYLGCRAVTFGCPRLWWSADDPPEIAHVRVACDDDPVPMVPHLFFKHDCREVIILSDRDNEIVNPEDHNISVYQHRLPKYQ